MLLPSPSSSTRTSHLSHQIPLLSPAPHTHTPPCSFIPPGRTPPVPRASETMGFLHLTVSATGCFSWGASHLTCHTAGPAPPSGPPSRPLLRASHPCKPSLQAAPPPRSQPSTGPGIRPALEAGKWGEKGQCESAPPHHRPSPRSPSWPRPWTALDAAPPNEGKVHLP